ncbi:MAG: peptide chain release factor N(5)-glutamine methyltransferase [Chloroflexi bacterium]|nr:peptide chain release factor N(5)-glutamine methyltransferase [Chloroflexota bacterium]
MKLAESWVSVRDRLSLMGVEDASLEAEVLHRQALEMDRVGFFSELQTEVPFEHAERVRHLAERRLAGEPLPYITGIREFYGLDFMVDSQVLVPRQETELLVDLTLMAVTDMGLTRPVIADVGTGSGAIAIALASRLSLATVYATDVSQDALDVAQRNCERYGVADRVRLMQGDLLSTVTGKLDIIVSNPPYIPSVQLATLPSDVQREPRMALDGGPDGLDVIRRLLGQVQEKLQPNGRLMFELSPEQVEEAMEIAHEAFPERDVSFERDLLKLPRVIVVS